MATSGNVVVFDSSGLVSLVKADDSLHGESVRIAEKIMALGWQMVLPYEVLAETLNTIGKLIHKKSAILVGESVMEQYAAHEMVFMQSESHITASALQHLKSAAGSPSFIDCLVMACADEYKTPYIFGFDATFKKNGYRLPV